MTTEETDKECEEGSEVVDQFKLNQYRSEKFKQCLNLRDRAAQVALNFAGQTISSYDGTYTLLIDCIYDALKEVAEGQFYDEEVFVISVPVSKTEGDF